jgi:hypothetical protein
MTEIFNSNRAVGLRVKVPSLYGDRIVKGTIVHVLPNSHISVVYDPVDVGEWEDNFRTFRYPYRDVKLDYDPEGMKLINQLWSSSTGQIGGPKSPMKNVKSFLTGRSRKRKTRKRN